MGSKILLIAIIFLNILSYSECYSKEKRFCPFVLNQYNQVHENLHIGATYSYNNLQNALVLMRQFGQFEPVLKSGEPFFTYNFNIFYRRFGIEIGEYNKNYPKGGVYAIGWRPDNNAMIVGYDETKVIIKNFKDKYFVFSCTLFQRKYFCIGAFYNSYKQTPGIMLSTNFKKFCSTLGVVAPLEWYLPNASIYFFSFSLKVLKCFSIFEEVKSHRKGGVTDLVPGYINIFGINLNLLKYIHVAVYYHYFHNNLDYDVPYNRSDHRIGFQLKIESDIDLK